HTVQLVDLRVDERPPGALLRRPARWCEQLAHLCEGEAEALAEADHGKRLDRRRFVAALAADTRRRLEQARRLVVAQGRSAKAGARGDLADRQQILHLTSS